MVIRHNNGKAANTNAGTVKIIDELEPEQKSHIYAIIDMAVSNNRLKSTLTNALSANF